MLDKNDTEAAEEILKIIYNAYNKITTRLYDDI